MLTEQELLNAKNEWERLGPCSKDCIYREFMGRVVPLLFGQIAGLEAESGLLQDRIEFLEAYIRSE